MATLMTGYAGETGITTGKFVRRRRSDGAYWSTSGTPAFEAYNAANIANYGIAATEVGLTGTYTATDPSDTTAGDYAFVKAAGASLAVSDLVTGIRWQDDVIITTATGTGARTVTLTVNDGTTVIAGAIVRIYLNAGDNQVATTNSSGVVTFSSAADGTYTVSIGCPGYSFTPTTLSVTANTTATYSMTAVSIPASAVGFTTGYTYTYSESGVVESGVEITIQLTSLPSGTGIAGDTAIRTGTSNGSGLVSFTNLILGATYKLTRGSSYIRTTISATAGASTALGNLSGTP